MSKSVFKNLPVGDGACVLAVTVAPDLFHCHRHDAVAGHALADTRPGVVGRAGLDVGVDDPLQQLARLRRLLVAG